MPDDQDISNAKSFVYQALQELSALPDLDQYNLYNRVCADYRDFAPGRSEVIDSAYALGLWPLPAD
jgi:hypothetical protein